LVAVARLSLFRRRQIWIPTLWGWLVLFALAGAAFVLAGRNMYVFLAPNDRAAQARVLVVEGWLSDKELDQAITAFLAGKYERVITTGGPIEAWPELRGSLNYADLAARYLKTHGLENANVTAVPTPASAQDRTFLSAVMVRDWATQRGLALTAFDLFSAGTHARRSRMLYRMAFGPNVVVGVLAARPQYDERRWWRTSVGATSVIEESVGLLWTMCCFYPPPPGTHEEKWAVPPHAVRQ
jgi:hypothetical protein